MIIDKLGRKGDSVEYLHGIFFTPSFAPATVPELKRLFMGDACHLNFGKYTLFSCYGVTANCNMSPVAFVIVFLKREWYDMEGILEVCKRGTPNDEPTGRHNCH